MMNRTIGGREVEAVFDELRKLPSSSIISSYVKNKEGGKKSNKTDDSINYIEICFFEERMALFPPQNISVLYENPTVITDAGRTCYIAHCRIIITDDKGSVVTRQDGIGARSGNVFDTENVELPKLACIRAYKDACKSLGIFGLNTKEGRQLIKPVSEKSEKPQREKDIFEIFIPQGTPVEMVASGKNGNVAYRIPWDNDGVESVLVIFSREMNSDVTLHDVIRTIRNHESGVLISCAATVNREYESRPNYNLTRLISYSYL